MKKPFAALAAMGDEGIRTLTDTVPLFHALRDRPLSDELISLLMEQEGVEPSSAAFPLGFKRRRHRKLPLAVRVPLFRRPDTRPL